VLDSGGKDDEVPPPSRKRAIGAPQRQNELEKNGSTASLVTTASTLSKFARVYRIKS
jgi:hypothetical protein